MPKVGIIMGSDSDLKVMSKAAVMLEELGIEYEMTIISAHREPDELIEWTRGAESRGIKVMIAGAGMAAALPGMCAALFALPVIGVPLSERICDRMSFGKESGWNGCSVFNHADAAGSSGCNCCDRWRKECSNSCSKDSCGFR